MSEQTLFVRVTVIHFGEFGVRSEQSSEVQVAGTGDRLTIIDRKVEWGARVAHGKAKTLADRLLDHVERELEGVDG